MPGIKEQIIDLLEQLEKSQQTDDAFRVIHYNDNPIDSSIKHWQQEYENLKRENERLRARLELLESESQGDVTQRVDDVVSKSHQVEELTKTVFQLKAREEKILASFGKTSQEFRQACYLLIGYRIDAHRGNIYELSHMYNDQDDAKLSFKVGPRGDIELLENQSTRRLGDLVQTYLKTANSFPAFLAAITLRLFKITQQQQHVVDMSITMSNVTQCMSETMNRTMNRSARKTRPVVSSFQRPIAPKPDELASLGISDKSTTSSSSTHLYQSAVARGADRSTTSNTSYRNNDSTMSINNTVIEVRPRNGEPVDNSKVRLTDCVKQVEELTKKIAELKEREEKILVSFKRTSREFREVTYLLTGFRVEVLKDGVFRLSSMYAEQEEDKLIFQLEEGEVQLLENAYAKRLSPFILTYLEEADSFPAFLAAITLDLFKASTQQVDMSMSMATTMLGNFR